MSAVLPSTPDTADLALRVVERPSTTEWLVLQVPDGQARDIADELAADAEAIGDAAVERVHAETARALIEEIRRPGDAIRVFSGLEHLSEDEWRYLDQARSLLAREGGIVLVMPMQSTEYLFRYAPNLASWVGAAVWSLDDLMPTLSEDEKERRLEALRAWSGLTDDEMIDRAERDELARDPAYAEWLVLLERGDLVWSREQS